MPRLVPFTQHNDCNDAQLVDDQPLIALNTVNYAVQGRTLVRDVSFSLSRGKIVTLIGPNGAGKSTTARIVLGAIQPTSGRCQRKTGVRIGYVPQRLQINRAVPMRVERFMCLTNNLNAEELTNALAVTGAEELAKKELSQLSGGELQRVLLARAFARKPDVLVLDEPVQGVDFSGEIAMYRQIDQMRKNTQCAVLLISHDLHIVMAQTDWVICLNTHMCCQGVPQQVVQNSAYTGLFGNRDKDLALYRHHAHHS